MKIFIIVDFTIYYGLYQLSVKVIEENTILLKENEPHKTIVCCGIHSRHKGKTIYKVYIQLNSTLVGYESIDGWYCDL